MIVEKVFDSAERKGMSFDYLFAADNITGPMPTLIYLHDSSCVGDDTSRLLNSGPIYEIRKGRKTGCITIVPQCKSGTWFESFDVLLEFLSYIRRQPETDQRRIYVSGYEMGAYAAWQLCMARPSMISAAVITCGGGMPFYAQRMKSIPVLAFHGALDKIVSPDETMAMACALNQAGGYCRFSLLENTGHNSIEDVFSSDEVWNWLVKQEKGKTKNWNS